MQFSDMSVPFLISLVLYAFFFVIVFYLLFLAISGHFGKSDYPVSSNTLKKFLVLIPSYKEDTVILQTVKAALTLDYPKDKFSVVVIADKLQSQTVEAIQVMGAKAIPVKFEKSTKSKSLRFALEFLLQGGETFDYTLILDADNIITPLSIKKLNAAFDAGFKAVQLHRTAKNKNTPIAYLDAVSEEINNHIFRKGMRATGGSSALIGSGMAFDFNYLNSIILTGELDENPGEDREIEIRLLKDGYTCEYIHDTFVFDEKVQNTDVMQKQRQRWISAQLQYLKQFFVDDASMIFSTNLNYFIKGMQNLIPPRVLLVFIIHGFFLFFLILESISLSIHLLHWKWWLCLALAIDLTLLISIPRKLYTRELLRSIWHLPSSFIAMASALLRSKFKQKEFIHTVKTYHNTKP